ncbi:hypothetical protein AB0J82_11990 [Asanoa sp. NPDC049518]|uniref:hypothetical protein n=1 Tax=unclassified Asanoa TaxID=2685164 RepID=UPI003416CD45
MRWAALAGALRRWPLERGTVTGGRGWVLGAALSVFGVVVVLLTRRRSPRRG